MFSDRSTVCTRKPYKHGNDSTPHSCIIAVWESFVRLFKAFCRNHLIKERPRKKTARELALNNVSYTAISQIDYDVFPRTCNYRLYGQNGEVKDEIYL